MTQLHDWVEQLDALSQRPCGPSEESLRSAHDLLDQIEDAVSRGRDDYRPLFSTLGGDYNIWFSKALWNKTGDNGDFARDKLKEDLQILHQATDSLVGIGSA